jgi:EmrB/QacA subfamily drug resistance transporter
VILASLDLFIVNVALPDIARDFGTTDVAELSWVLNGYAIVYASLLVFFGRLADRHRRDRGFLVGVAVFTVASAACAASTSVGMLVAFRLVQAAGAALLTPTSLGLVLASYPPECRSGAVRTWTAIGGVSAALGPVIGGLLVAASWRWVFLVNVPVGLVALVVGWRRLPHVPGHPVRRPDAAGATLVTVGVALLTFGLVKGGAWGWGSPTTLGVLALAAVLVGLFVWHCARADNPLIDPGLFRVRTFSGASLVAATFSASFGAMLLSIVLWEQDAWGWSALKAGLAIAPGPLMVPLVSFLVAGRLIARLGAGVVVTIGSVAFATGVGWWALCVGLQPDYAGAILGGMILTGIGVGLTLPTLMATAASSLPPSSFATGSAVVNMIRQIGLAIGVTVLLAVLAVPATSLERLAAFRRGWWVGDCRHLPDRRGPRPGAAPGPVVPHPLVSSGRRLGRRPPEGEEEAGAAAEAPHRSDHQTFPPPQRGQPGRLVEAPPPRAYGGQQEAGHGQHHHVLPPLAGPEDEEPVGTVIGDPGDHHDADHTGPTDRGQQPQHQQRAGADLGNARRPRVEPPRLHAQTLEPPARPGDLAATEDVIDAVGEEDGPDGYPEYQQGEVDGVDVGHFEVSIFSVGISQWGVNKSHQDGLADRR